MYQVFSQYNLHPCAFIKQCIVTLQYSIVHRYVLNSARSLLWAERTACSVGNISMASYAPYLELSNMILQLHF